VDLIKVKAAFEWKPAEGFIANYANSISRVDQLNSTLADFIDELVAWANNIDTSYTITGDGASSNKTEMCKRTVSYAKALQKLEKAAHRWDMAFMILSGLKAIHTDSTPAELNERLDIFRYHMQRAEGKHCITDTAFWSKWIRTDNPVDEEAISSFNPVTGESETRPCHVSFNSSDTVKRHVEEFCAKNSKNAIAEEQRKLRLNVQEAEQILQVNSTTSFQNMLYGLVILWETEKEEGVTKEFKDELAEDWNNAVDKALDELSKNPEPEHTSMLGPILLGVVLMAGTFFALKKRGV